MSLKVAKSLLCGLLIAQVSTVAFAAPSKLANAEIAKCAAVKAQGPTAHTSCFVAANTKLIERRLNAEKNIASLFKTCELKFSKLSTGKEFAVCCREQGALRRKSINFVSIEETLKYQQGLAAFVAEKTAMAPATHSDLIAKQTEAIKENASFVENAEQQLAVASGPIKKSYKNITKKNF